MLVALSGRPNGQIHSNSRIYTTTYHYIDDSDPMTRSLEKRNLFCVRVVREWQCEDPQMFYNSKWIDRWPFVDGFHTLLSKTDLVTCLILTWSNNLKRRYPLTSLAPNFSRFVAHLRLWLKQSDNTETGTTSFLNWRREKQHLLLPLIYIFLFVVTVGLPDTLW